MIAGVFLVSIDFLHVKTAKHLKRIIFQRILVKVGAVIYEYYKNAFDERCEKEIFKACEFDSRQANARTNITLPLKTPPDGGGVENNISNFHQTFNLHGIYEKRNP